MARGILVPLPGIKTQPPALEGQGLNHDHQEAPSSFKIIFKEELQQHRII